MDKDKIIARLKEFTSNVNISEWTPEMWKEWRMLSSDPEGKAYLESLSADAPLRALQKEATEAYKKEQSIGTAASTALSVYDLAQASRQKKLAKKALANLPETGSYSGYKRNELLDSQINQALKDISNPNATPQVRAAAQSVIDSYNSNLGTARMASGGQASTYATLAGKAAEDRRRAGIDVGKLAGSTRDQAQNRLAGLTQQRIGEDQFISNQSLNAYTRRLSDRRRAEEAAGSLLRSSNVRRDDALSNLTTQLPVAFRNFDSKNFLSKVKGGFNSLFNKGNSFQNPYLDLNIDYNNLPMDELNNQFRMRTYA